VCAKSSPRAAASPAHRRPPGRDGNATPYPQLPQGHRRHRAGVLETTFKRKPRPIYSANRLCFAAASAPLSKAGFETLVEAGYQPESAYFECLHELKLIVDLIYRGGLAYMRYSISDQPSGATTSAAARSSTKRAACDEADLTEIQNGKFAKNILERPELWRKKFEAFRKKEAKHPIEVIGKTLRASMPLPRPRHRRRSPQTR